MALGDNGDNAGPLRRRAGPVPGVVGVPLSLLYRVGLGRVNRRFDRGTGVVRFDRPVISVGNLSVGGTGKTPLVEAIVRFLTESGHTPCIAMRGYSRDGKESDEAAAYRRLLPDVPVIAQSNRTLGLIRQFGKEHDEADGRQSDCIILDDGFQHRQIGRELDIVLIDAGRDPFQDRLLPAGWLREPLESLKRAGAVVITHAESVSGADLTALERRIAAAVGQPAQAVCRHGWSELLVNDAGRESAAPVSWLSGKRIVAACAIGNPGPFVAAARKAAGGNLSAEVVLRDHDPFAPTTVERLKGVARSVNAQAIVVTEKDWSKLSGCKDWPCPVVRAVLKLSFDRGWDMLSSQVLDTVTRGVPDDEVGGPTRTNRSPAPDHYGRNRNE